MFTGIIETLGEITQIDTDWGNRVFTVKSDIAPELKVDQSVSHNGVCLTVSSLDGPDRYQVVAVSETLDRTNLGSLAIGDLVNLERSMVMGGRIDGHMVQGHVDQTAICKSINETNGSWALVFEFETNSDHVLIDKGSICVNGVSLTCFNVSESSLEVAIIPYTYENTNFKDLSPGDVVNLEFDVIGKYVQAALKKKIKNYKDPLL
jgi:riboflavin synthase